MRVTEATKQLAATSKQFERAVQRYVCPIYSVTTTGAESVGSGFLLSVSSLTLLCTAAHVLDRARSAKLQIPAGNRVVPIEGDPFLSVDLSAKADDRFGCDFGFVVLRPNEMLAAPTTPALTLADLDIDDVPAPRVAYGFAGVPSSKNPNLGGYFDGRSYFYGGLPAKSEDYRLTGYMPSTHLLMRFDRRRMLDVHGGIRAVPKPFGMSGGPVFRIGSFDEIRTGKACPRVVAIGIRWLKDSRLLLGVRMSLFVDALRQLIPSLDGELPQPAFVEGKYNLLPKA